MTEETKINARQRVVLLVAVVVLLVVGVAGATYYLAAGPGRTASPAAAAQISGPAPSGGRYPTAAALAQALVRAGATCTGLRPPPSPPPGRDSAQCVTAGGTLTLTVFADPAGVQTEAQAMGQASFLRGQTMLAGENWTAVGPDAVLEAVAPRLGGQMIKSPR